MKIAVLSDIHANIYALESVRKEIRRQNVDSVICLGDLVMTGPHPAESYDLMESLKPDVWLQGNTDGWIKEMEEDFHPQTTREKEIYQMYLWSGDKLSLSQKRKLINRPIYQSFEFDGVPLSFCHGSPSSYSRAILPDAPIGDLNELTGNMKSDYLFCGHSHLRFVKTAGNKLIINFGSISIPGEDYSKQAGYGIIHIRKGHISFQQKECEYDYIAFKQDLISKDFPHSDTIIKMFER